MIKSSIEISENIDDLDRLFSSEEKELSNKRANYKVLKKENKLIFEIKANDAVALRAITNSISKILVIYEKTRVVCDGN